MNVNWYIDAHSHIYENFSIDRLISSAQENFSSLESKNQFVTNNSVTDNSENSIFALALVEKAGSNFFEKFEEHNSEKLLITKKNGYLECNSKQFKKSIIIFPGRQINTKENLEILSYGTAEYVEDGLSLEEVITKIKSLGGIVAINWGLGKWSFGRGKIVKRIIESSDKYNLLLCDTAIRPAIYPLPKIMRDFKKGGGKLVYGSDPFPLKGQERLVGSYSSFYLENISENQTTFDDKFKDELQVGIKFEENYLKRFRYLLLHKEAKPIGKRRGLIEVVETFR